MRKQPCLIRFILCVIALGFGSHYSSAGQRTGGGGGVGSLKKHSFGLCLFMRLSLTVRRVCYHIFLATTFAHYCWPVGSVTQCRRVLRTA